MNERVDALATRMRHLKSALALVSTDRFGCRYSRMFVIRQTLSSCVSPEGSEGAHAKMNQVGGALVNFQVILSLL